ncbi:hypothetical protein BDV98DRAFT_560422 [Pterulicium gracile]|uniref:Uncharacterized protein n=1 Tax=Pterulicium gracile TaxID=1884261 RepID=A0A5C3QUN6_9AGAR|nr:hypothetical protein BDV98DRAFT_560422 [Pterula gracilis]
MTSSTTLSAMSALTKAAQKLVPSTIVPSLRPRTGNLYEVISRTPLGNGRQVVAHQTRWSAKQIPDCYWIVKRAEFKNEGKHGKAWGSLIWKGKAVGPAEQRIPGALKYTWEEGSSQPLPTPAKR